MNYVGYEIEAFMAFLSEKPDNGVADLFSKANDEMGKSSDEIGILLKCEPNCSP
jgi:hypothetical protein